MINRGQLVLYFLFSLQIDKNSERYFLYTIYSCVLMGQPLSYFCGDVAISGS